MKRCPECGSTFHDRVDFCFRDGAILASVAAAPPPEERPTEVVAPLDLKPDPGALDAPMPMGLRAAGLSGGAGAGGAGEPSGPGGAFDAPDPSFAPSPGNLAGFGAAAAEAEALPPPVSLTDAPAGAEDLPDAPAPGSEFDEGLTSPAADGGSIPDPAEPAMQQGMPRSIEDAYDQGLGAETAPFPIPPRRKKPAAPPPVEDDATEPEVTAATEPAMPHVEPTAPTEPLDAEHLADDEDEEDSGPVYPPYAEPQDRKGGAGVFLIAAGVGLGLLLLLGVGVLVLGGGLTATSAGLGGGDEVVASSDEGAGDEGGPAERDDGGEQIEPPVEPEGSGSEALAGTEDPGADEGAEEGGDEAGVAEGEGTEDGEDATGAEGAGTQGGGAAAGTGSRDVARGSQGGGTTAAGGGSTASAAGTGRTSSGGSTGTSGTSTSSAGTASSGSSGSTTSSGSTGSTSSAGTGASGGTADASVDPWGMPTESASGSFSISTTPAGAMVYVDNRAVGKSPISTDQPYGLHTVRVELDGYKTDARTVDLQTSSMAVPFELRPVVVTGKVNILGGGGTSGAALYVDGNRVGQLPATANLSEGTHTFKVELADGTSFTRILNIRFEVPGRPVTVTLEAP